MMHTGVTLSCALFVFAAFTASKPIEGNLNLEGLSNKIRSGAVAIANPARPSDSRVQRIVSKDGIVINQNGEAVGPNGEIIDQDGRVIGQE